jgi:hypothetical protein
LTAQARYTKSHLSELLKYEVLDNIWNYCTFSSRTVPWDLFRGIDIIHAQRDKLSGDI